jgi:hypothetical protein
MSCLVKSGRVSADKRSLALVTGPFEPNVSNNPREIDYISKLTSLTSFHHEYIGRIRAVVAAPHNNLYPPNNHGGSPGLCKASWFKFSISPQRQGHSACK